MGDPVMHFDIRSEHPDELWGFYHDVFGWIVHPDPSRTSALADTRSPMGIGGGIGRSDEEGPGVTIYVEVPDIDETLLAVERHGGKIVTPRTAGGPVVLARFRDPHGSLIGLVESAGVTGDVEVGLA